MEALYQLSYSPEIATPTYRNSRNRRVPRYPRQSTTGRSRYRRSIS